MSTVLVLRTSDKDGKSHGGFQWPTSGTVECPDWNPRAECGNGLHGLLWGEGDASLMSSEANALWQVVEVVAEAIVKVGQKVKFPRGTVVYSGARHGALKMVLLSKQKLDSIRAIALKGDGKTDSATTGDSAHSATTGNSAHSATTGNYAHSATTGDSAHSATTGYYAHSATTGDSAHSATTGNYAHSATTGKNGIAVALGADSRVKAGQKGVIVARYFDEKADRVRVLTGYVGEDDIKADTWYEVKVLKSGVAKWKAVAK